MHGILETTWLEPSRPAQLACIMVHGRTQTANFMRQQAMRLAVNELIVALPQATGNTWYPLGFMEPLENNQPALEAALALVDGLVGECVQRGFERNRILLAGFSQGACLLSEYVGRNPGRYAGLIAWTGARLGPANVKWGTIGDYGGTPMMFTCARHDPWVPLERARQTAEHFGVRGAEIRLESFEGNEHCIRETEIDLARSLIKRAMW